MTPPNNTLGLILLTLLGAAHAALLAEVLAPGAGLLAATALLGFFAWRESRSNVRYAVSGIVLGAISALLMGGWYPGA